MRGAPQAAMYRMANENRSYGMKMAGRAMDSRARMHYRNQ